MEAASYLSSGYGLRRSIERQRGWVKLGSLARFWAPPRIKQVFVDKEYGTPYLNTSQVFEVRPAPRKFLAREKISKAESRLAQQGTILVMASASPGRSTLVTAAHENSILSHHFMRVEPRSEELWGWIYAYLKSPQGQAMMSGSQYASIIRHIEPHHVEALPVPMVSEVTALDFQQKVERILSLRNSAFELGEEADRRFAEAIGPVRPDQREDGFEVSSSLLSVGRRRLEASRHNPVAAGIISKFKKVDRLGDITKRIWWMSRFKRFYGEGGLPYISADELFSINPQGSKKILVSPDDNHADYFVDPDWIVMACSGQTYGMNGAATLLSEHHANTFFSHDLIRISADKEKVRPGFLVTALTHRTHGRPLLIREAYGTSIPHLDPSDVAQFPVVRLSKKVEDAIADLAESSARSRFEADVLEQQLAIRAGALVDRFIAGVSEL
ncbi:hypothetical protein J2X02_002659 [Pseudoxanthomonas japonensis]|uniref:hypothetical protein n=1 Tax=Pseudoxanthomonas japonensis TaxID=69284 RepID=UPI0028592EA8|nr:hypothetical protein [Pseudoxanthomonas japonensis]MDR7069808.1 hypothetical protein [Pseudoxanthomonas japonensis]